MPMIYHTDGSIEDFIKSKSEVITYFRNRILLEGFKNPKISVWKFERPQSSNYWYMDGILMMIDHDDPIDLSKRRHECKDIDPNALSSRIWIWSHPDKEKIRQELKAWDDNINNCVR
jgi:hypothetical protein